jgi:hypothetical protein
MSGQISIAISTSSQVMKWSSTLPAAQPPTLKVNNLAIQPSNPPNSPTGLQLVVFDITQTIPTPASILVNTWLTVYPQDQNSNNWWNTYNYIYTNTVSELLSNGDPSNQLVILCSFGLDANMSPDNDSLALFLNYGAGQQLQYWMNHNDQGSQVDNPTSWVSFPANYILVGFGGIGYGHGSEVYQTPAGSNTSITTPLNVTLDPDARQLKAA